ncbi:hypothetical protein F66182_12261, partial [Fusarium sp. NRRL 66182]
MCPWNSGREIALWIVFGVLLIAFCAQQYTCLFTDRKRRIFPAQFLKHRTLVLCFICTNCAATAFFVIVYYLPVYFQFVYNDSALESAVRLLPMVICFVILSIVARTTMAYVGYYFPFYIVAGVSIATGGALMYTVDKKTSTSAIYGFSVLIGLGSGSMMQAAYSIGPAKVIPVWEDIPPVIGFINVAQIGGVVHSLAISGVIFQNYAFQYVSAAVKDLRLSPAQIRSAIAGTNSAVFDTMTPEQQSLAIGGIANAMQ